jgi:hypothetical protein
VTPGELARTPSWIVFVTQPEGGQVEGDRPPLGSLGEESHLLVTEVESLRSDKELPGLVLRERQIGGTQLAQNATAPESREGEARIDARSGDHSYSRSKVLERVLEQLEALVILHEVEIVEDDRQRRYLGEVAEELLQSVAWGDPPRADHLRRPLAGARHRSLDGVGDRGPEAHRVVVATFQSEPRDAFAGGALAPGRQQGRLPVSGRGAHERQRP